MNGVYSIIATPRDSSSECSGGSGCGNVDVHICVSIGARIVIKAKSIVCNHSLHLVAVRYSCCTLLSNPIKSWHCGSSRTPTLR